MMRVTMRRNEGKGLQKNKLPEQVFDQLMEWIMEGKLSMGDKLNAEDLAAELGVSRMPVREALANLEKIGLAKTVPYTGTTLVRLTKQDVQEIYLARSAMEPIAARFACIRITKKELDELKKIHEDYIRTVRREVLDPMDIYLLNRRFHFSIYMASNLPRVCEYIEQLWDNLTYFKFIYGQKLLMSDERKESMIQEHQAYLDALTNGDSDRIFYDLKKNLEIRAADIANYTDGYFGMEEEEAG